MFASLRMLTLTGALAVAATIGLCLPASATVPTASPGPTTPAAPVTLAKPPAAQVKQACPAPKPRHVACMSLVRTGTPVHRGLQPADSLPQGYGPADLASAYKLPPGGGVGETVAVVDAGDDPSAESNLAVYRQQYGLPPCTTANGCFRKVNETGGTSYPAPLGGWETEESLDIDMVSAICPNCHILLVEASTTSINDLATGVDTAVALGAKYVSNSYGGAEFSGEAQLDQDYDHPGVAVTVSAGDDNYGVAYPAASPYVTSVGGTTLTRAPGTARGWTETVWSHSGHGTGSGCSAYEPKPSFQHDKGCANRTVADVSAVADPDTGVAVYDTADENGWLVVGGTSVASPVIASVYALAGAPASGQHPNSYPYANPSALNNVTVGKNGDCSPAYLCTAGPGYNGPTGLGTPDGTAAFRAPGTQAPSGTITGTVTGASTGEPLSGATVSAGGDLTVHTSPSGQYSATLPAGSYTLTVSGYGDVAQTAAVTVTASHVVTRSFALAAAPLAAVSGTVTDGSGEGWPLAATITVPGTPQPPVYTNPVTGRYSVSLPEGAQYTLKVSADGYQTADQQMTASSGSVQHDISLSADGAACTAPGYSYHYTGVPLQTFTAASAPPGWQVTTATGPVSWSFGPLAGLNDTGGTSGGLAAVNEPQDNTSQQVDTTLTTPVADLTSATDPVISFDTFYVQLDDTASVDLSLDGGTTWTSVWTASGTLAGQEQVPIPQAAGKPDVLVRFHFTSSTENTYNEWQLDDVYVGTRACDPNAGGLIVGRVLDANTGKGVNGANLASVDAPADTATSAAGPPDVGDGFYELFSSVTGDHPFTVSDEPYVPATATVDVTAGKVASADISLKAGRLAATPAALIPTAVLGRGSTATFTVANTGTAPATLSMSQQPGQTSPLPASPARAEASATWSAIPDYPISVYGNSVVRGSDGDIYSVGGSINTAASNEPNGENATQSFVYDPGTRAWSPIPEMPIPVYEAAAGLVDGKIVVAGGLTDTGTTAAVQIYDPATSRWTLGPDMPQPIAAGGAAVFDDKLWVVGGDYCTENGCAGEPFDSVYAYDLAASRWSAAAVYPTDTFLVSCGGFNGLNELVCAGGSTGAGVAAQAYAYHPESGSWTPVASMPLALTQSAYAVANDELVISGGFTQDSYFVSNGFAYDPASKSWSTIPFAPTPGYGAGAACGFFTVGGSDTIAAYRYADQLSGFDQCTSQPAKVPWLSSSTGNLTLQPGQSAKFTVHVTAAEPGVTQPGTYRADLALQSDTPYGVPPVQIAFKVTAPAGWGQIAGTVTGLDCNGTATPLAGNTVEITGQAGTYSLATDADGQYSYWLKATDSPLTLIAYNDQYLSQTKKVSLRAGKTTTANFALKPAQKCG